MEYLSILKTINACHGAAGEEGALMRCLKELLVPLVDSAEIDRMGNLICRRHGSGPKVMLTARADSGGLIVSHIDSDGKLRFGKLGDIKTELLLHQSFRFAGGAVGTVSAESAGDHDLTPAQCWLDIGAANAEDAAQTVQLGDTAVFCAEPREAGDYLLSPYLSDRAACLALMEMLELKSDFACDLTVVFAAQGSLGDRGIRAAVFAEQPELCVCVDTVPAVQGNAVPGKAPVLKIMDDSVISHTEMIHALSEAAEKAGIPYQKLISSGTRSTGGQVQPLYGGVLTGGISIPCRYRGTAGEMVHRNDIAVAAKWLAAFVGMDLSGLKGDSYGSVYQ